MSYSYTPESAYLPVYHTASNGDLLMVGLFVNDLDPPGTNTTYRAAICRKEGGTWVMKASGNTYSEVMGPAEMFADRDTEDFNAWLAVEYGDAEPNPFLEWVSEMSVRHGQYVLEGDLLVLP